MFSRLYTTGEGSVPELRSYYDFCYEDVPSNPLVQLYESWLDEISRHKKTGRVLDIGCGTGLFLAVARRRGWEPFGIDDCAEATTHARDHFGLDVWAGDFEEFAEGRRSFDLITAWDIIEHARKPIHLLRAMHRSLTADGILGISTPNQRSILDVVAGALYRITAGRITGPLEKFYIEQHFLYFTPKTIEQALARSELELVHLKREETNLCRLTLSRPMHFVLRVLFAAARLMSRENRLFALAGAPSGEAASGSRSSF